MARGRKRSGTEGQRGRDGAFFSFPSAPNPVKGKHNAFRVSDPQVSTLVPL